MSESIRRSEEEDVTTDIQVPKFGILSLSHSSEESQHLLCCQKGSSQVDLLQSEDSEALKLRRKRRMPVPAQVEF